MASSAAAAFADLSIDEMEAIVDAKIAENDAKKKTQQLQAAREKADAAHTQAMTNLEAKMLSKGIEEVSISPLKPIAPHPDTVQAAIARKNPASSDSSGSGKAVGGRWQQDRRRRRRQRIREVISCVAVVVAAAWHRVAGSNREGFASVVVSVDDAWLGTGAAPAWRLVREGQAARRRQAEQARRLLRRRCGAYERR